MGQPTDDCDAGDSLVLLCCLNSSSWPLPEEGGKMSSSCAEGMRVWEEGRNALSLEMKCPSHWKRKKAFAINFCEVLCGSHLGWLAPRKSGK